MTPEKHTTYIDIKRRKWVIINLWYSQLTSNEITHVTLYRVDSHQEYVNIAIATWHEMIEKKQISKL